MDGNAVISEGNRRHERVKWIHAVRGRFCRPFFCAGITKMNRRDLKVKQTTGKKLTALLCAAVLAITSIVSAAAQSGDVRSDWPQFRGPAQSAGVTDAKTPTTKEDTAALWTARLGSGWGATPGTPIIVGDYLYTFGNGKLNRLSTETGEMLKAVDCPGQKGFFSYITYGDGKIFVPCTLNGRVVVIAYDEETMEQLWVSDNIGNEEDSLQPLSSVVYHDGYIYMGVSNGSADKGLFVAMTTEDEDPTDSSERKEFAWTYAPETGNQGYYWANGAIVGDAIVFGGESGELTLHSLTDDTVYDTITVDGAIRSTVDYDVTSGRVFVTTKSGYIHSVKVNANHTFDKSSLISKFISGDITSSPVVYNGRLYLGGGGISSAAEFSVLDANTLEIIYKIDEILSQSSPIITTAYATEENNQQVYIYMVKYNGYANGGYEEDSSCLYAIKDSQGQTEPSYETIAIPSVLQYCTQSVAVGEDGTLYYYNDSGNLFAFGHKNPADGVYTAQDVVNAINRLPAADQVTSLNRYQAEQVRARYESLSASEQAEVSNLDVLEQVESMLEESEQVAKLIESIAAIDPEQVTLEDGDKLNQLKAIYLSLSEEGRAQVTNYDVLEQAIARLAQLQETEVVAQLQERIASVKAVEDLVLDDTDAVEAVYRFYMDQSDAVKAQADATRLLDARKYLAELNETIDAISNDIWNKLDPMNITLADKATVEDLMARYNALKPEDRKHVKYYEDVLDAQKKIAELEKAQPEGTQGGGSSATEKNASNSGQAESVATGDSSAPIYFLMLALAGGVLVVLKLGRKAHN